MSTHALVAVVRHLPSSLQPPGRARVSPRSHARGGRRRVARRRFTVDDHVDVFAAALGQPGAQVADVRRRSGASGDLDLRHHPVASEHAPHRLRPRPHPHHPDRDALLYGLRHLIEIGSVGLVVVVASVVLRPAFPQRPDQVDTLIETFGPHREIDDLTGERQIGADRAEPDGEDRAPRRQLIEGDDLARHLPRTPPGQRGEQGAEHHARGPRGHRRQERPCVDAVRGLPDKHAVPARLLCHDRLLELLGRRPTREHHSKLHPLAP